jgi:hypothetical protein
LRTSLKTLLAAGAGLCLALGAATPALAAPASHGAGGTSDKLVGVVHLINSHVVEVQAQYRCTGSPSDLHLWISVKQSANGTADPALADGGTGFGHKATAWTQGHSGVADLVCDSHTHVGKFIIDRTEYGYGDLVKGRAYVQFCLFDANNPEPADPTAEGAAPPVSSMVFMNVR